MRLTALLRPLSGLVPLLALASTAVFAAPSLHAMQIENRILISPITGKPFSLAAIPVRKDGQINPGDDIADMGVDDDGCRHTSGISEYDLYIATDPYSYFTALTIEYDDKGRFGGNLPKGFAEWVTGKDGFHGEWVLDREHSYKRAQQLNQDPGRKLPPLTEWEMPQEDIPLDKRYRYAIASYSQRGMPASFVGKLALSGAWALRARVNKPVIHTRLGGGIQEVDARVAQKIQDGEKFNLAKWTTIYRDIFRSARLTDEGYFVAGMVYFGFALREGDVEESLGILDKMTERFKDAKDGEMLRGLVRERRRIIRQGYLPFLEQAGAQLRIGIANEEVPRPNLPGLVLAVAESLRRFGDLQGAADWYDCLARMAETQPQVRAEIRAAGKAPAPDAPYLLLLGWRADERLAQMAERKIVPAKDGSDRKLITAIVSEGLGLPDYVNPDWKPRTNGSVAQTQYLLEQSGLALLDYQFKMRVWPDSLDTMWYDGILRDRNHLNRFHDPVNGDKLLYLRPEFDTQAPDTVLIATAKAIATGDGPRYGAFLAGGKVAWSENPLLPGARAAAMDKPRAPAP